MFSITHSELLRGKCFLKYGSIKFISSQFLRSMEWKLGYPGSREVAVFPRNDSVPGTQLGFGICREKKRPHPSVPLEGTLYSAEREEES